MARRTTRTNDGRAWSSSTENDAPPPAEIAAAGCIANPDLIHPGQVVTIP
ncbi:hypothetical protein ACXDF8_06925 [Mycolicibacterium sp. CBM1]